MIINKIQKAILNSPKSVFLNKNQSLGYLKGNNAIVYK